MIVSSMRLMLLVQWEKQAQAVAQEPMVRPAPEVNRGLLGSLVVLEVRELVVPPANRGIQVPEVSQVRRVNAVKIVQAQCHN